MKELPAIALLAQAGGTSLSFLEQYQHILYPTLALFVLVLLGASVVSAWRSPKLEGVEKARLKGEVIRAMRQNIGWITAPELAESIPGSDSHAMAKILEEMKQDGVLISAMMENKIHFRLK